MEFKLNSKYQPAGDQPQAIASLINNLNNGQQWNCLLGATGTGKTFTMANIIQDQQRPSLVICHNKTLAAQLYSEFKEFFPDNAVEYYISHFDYFQPEAYLPQHNKYIQKDALINDELEKLRLSCATSLMSGRRDVIVVASVSCLFGAGNPNEMRATTIEVRQNQAYGFKQLLMDLSEALYSRNDQNPQKGNFRIIGDTIEVYPAYDEKWACRFIFWGDDVEKIERFEPGTGKKLSTETSIQIFPANLFVSRRGNVEEALETMERDLDLCVQNFVDRGLFVEAKRLEERTRYDLEMMRQLGYCEGIENYSRYIDKRSAGERAFCLLDYFPQDYLVFIDESHVTLPQMRAMYGGNRAMKKNLVDYGWRLPSAMDNRPLTFDEAENLFGQTIFVSATPGDYELIQTGGEVIEQIIRPTGLLDPTIEVYPIKNQVHKLAELIDDTIKNGDRVLVTTLTKKMAEHLSEFLRGLDIKTTYLHSDLKTPERVAAIREFRLGTYDVLVGVNMLREGLDMPEVGMVVIMDADKEGYLRNFRSMIQTIGRAARNANGRAVMFADKITGSMQNVIDETNRRRKLQMEHNQKHNIVPKTLLRSREDIIRQTKIADKIRGKVTVEQEKIAVEYNLNKKLSKKEMKEQIAGLKQEMLQAAKELDFIRAAQLRDLIADYEMEVK